MSDNTTPYNADVYEAEVSRTIPFHAEILAQAIAWARVAVPTPTRWLDTGCGPGRLVALARAAAPGTAFYCADPSAAMLTEARRNNPDLPEDRFLRAGSESLPDVGPFDVITAVLCHHFLSPTARELAVRRCRALLSPGGALIVIESTLADSARGNELQRVRWAGFLREQGRTEEQIQAHRAREGVHMFPIRRSEHFALFARAGFSPVEVIWHSYAQDGFLALAE
jgi:tRNA (cmo5U34)-methyltransferase